jgi:hypothetical protein
MRPLAIVTLLLLLTACASNEKQAEVRPNVMPMPPVEFTLVSKSTSMSMYANIDGKKQFQNLEGTPFFVVENYERNETNWRVHQWTMGVICKIPGAIITSVIALDTGAASYDKRDLVLHDKQSDYFKLWLRVCKH